jgi:glutathione S-transferase
VTIELFQFSGSHFNEKARWALDFVAETHATNGYFVGDPFSVADLALHCTADRQERGLAGTVGPSPWGGMGT